MLKIFANEDFGQSIFGRDIEYLTKKYTLWYFYQIFYHSGLHIFKTKKYQKSKDNA